jgi:hypothetical protein
VYQLTLYNAPSLFTAAGARLWVKPQSQRHRRQKRLGMARRLLTFDPAAAGPSDTDALQASFRRSERDCGRSPSRRGIADISD